MSHNSRTHKVFISFHHDDQCYKDKFAEMMDRNIVDKSVSDGDIDSSNNTEHTRQLIRDDFIADATVTVVLIGPCTWQRKYVDWEISSSLTDTSKNPRCGLLGILLPNHWNFQRDKCSPNFLKLVPPRLAANSAPKLDYASIYNWCEDVSEVKQWIDKAFKRRDKQPDPDNSDVLFGRNRSGPCNEGWKD